MDVSTKEVYLWSKNSNCYHHLLIRHATYFTNLLFGTSTTGFAEVSSSFNKNVSQNYRW